MSERINEIQKRLSNVIPGAMRGFVAFTVDDVATLRDALDERTRERDEARALADSEAERFYQMGRSSARGYK